LNADLAVTFSAIDPSTGGLSSIVKLSAPGIQPAPSVTVTMGANTATTYNSPFVIAETPTATGQYRLVTSASGVASGSSNTVTVIQPAITSISVGALGVGMHRTDSSIGLDSPAPPGGLVVNLLSSDPTRVQVPASVTIPAGQQGLGSAFTMTGLATTFDTQGRDHPITITASVRDGSWKPVTTQASVQPTLALLVQNVQTTRTTQSAPNVSIWTDLRCGTGGDCGILNADLAVTFSAIDPSTGGLSSIVKLSAPGIQPAPSVTVTMGANTATTYNSPFISAETPTGGGQYQIAASAPGVSSGSSNTVTVNQPAITSISVGTLGVGTHRTDSSIGLDSPAPAGGLVVNLSTTDPTIASVPVSVIIPAGQQGLGSAFTITGNKPGTVTVNASVSDGSWKPATTQATVQPSLAFVVQNVQTTRTTQSAPNVSIWTDLRCGTGGDCGILNADLAVTFSAIDPSTGGLSSIVKLSAPGIQAATSLTVKMAANTSTTYNTPFITAETPTATGRYQIMTSATGVSSGVSAVVTVTP
jgi:hypothetical protein